MPRLSLRRITRFRFTTYSTLLDGRQHHAGEFDLADAERAALAGRAHPAEEEAEHLPEGIEAEAARHHRIAVEMAGEEPEVRLDVEFGHDLALAVLAARLGDGVMRSNISIGGSGSCALPGPNSSPRAQASRSSKP